MRAMATCLLLAVSSVALANEPVQVMVLGTYHFGNPGQDVHNIEAEDVTTPGRQAQLAAVARVLAAFEPTVVAVERVTDPPAYRDESYDAFAPRQLREDPDERVQVGYRLAHLSGLDVVHGIDEQPSEGEPDYFPYGPLQAHVDRTGQATAFSATTAATKRMLDDFEGRQKTATVAELLIAANQALSDPSVYYEWLRLDVAEAQPASELIAYFYMRNAKIFAKLIDLTEPGDRVVVVFGAGHKHWLEHFVENTPGFELVDPVPYLQRAVGSR